MKKQILIAFIIVLGLFFSGCPSGDDNGKKPDFEKILVFQAYGTGEQGGAGVNRSFVELYNPGNKQIMLAGITLWFANGTRTNTIPEGSPSPAVVDSEWKSIELSGAIPAKGSFLILGPEKGSSANLIIAEADNDIYSSSFVLSNRAFKVALIESRTTLNASIQNPFDTDGNGTKVAGYIDMVGAANEYTPPTDPDQGEDTIYGFETAPARNSASQAVRRKDLNDTDDNSKDFIAARYNGMSADEMSLRRPRNSAHGAWDPFAP